MLYDQNFPRILWVDACNTTMYIQSKTPHRALGKKTPKGVFTRKKPEVSHLRIFESITYCHTLDEKRTKLNQTAEKDFLVRYSETSKAYKIYIPNNRNIVVRRDVKFMGDRALKRSHEKPAGDQNQLEKAPLVQQ